MSVLEAKKDLYQANPEHAIQALFDRVIVISDSAHALGATYKANQQGLGRTSLPSPSMLLRTLRLQKAVA